MSEDFFLGLFLGAAGGLAVGIVVCELLTMWLLGPRGRKSATQKAQEFHREMRRAGERASTWKIGPPSGKQ